VAAAKTNAAGTDLDPPAANAVDTPSSDPGSVQSAADAGAAAMTAATSGGAAENSAAAAYNAATSATATPPGTDAATVVADAAASATAAVAASATRVITELASTTATDKRLRGADGISAAGSNLGADASAGAAQAMSGTSSAANANAAAVPTLKVGAGVDSGEFGQGVANQVANMVAGNISSAKLSVNPPALGPIEVRIAVQGDQAQVVMTSHSAVTRDALQASTPRLREMLNQQGFGQVSVDISQRSFQDRTPAAHTYEWNSGSDRGDYSVAATSAGPATRAASGILDAYA
jgi:flagellar hook-length control protein FliK